MNAMVMNDKGIPIIETWAGMRQRHVEERFAVLRYMAESGLTLGQSAKLLAHGPNKLRAFIAYHGLGLKFNQPKNKPNTTREDRMAALLDERTALSLQSPRLTCREASIKLGISHDCLRVYSLRHKIPWKLERNWEAQS